MLDTVLDRMKAYHDTRENLLKEKAKELKGIEKYTHFYYTEEYNKIQEKYRDLIHSECDKIMIPVYKEFERVLKGIDKALTIPIPENVKSLIDTYLLIGIKTDDEREALIKACDGNFLASCLLDEKFHNLEKKRGRTDFRNIKKDVKALLDDINEYFAQLCNSQLEAIPSTDWVKDESQLVVFCKYEKHENEYMKRLLLHGDYIKSIKDEVTEFFDRFGLYNLE